MGCPPFTPTLFQVKVLLERILEVHESLPMRPVQLSPHCEEIGLVRKSLRDVETMTQVLGAPALPLWASIANVE